MVAVSIPHPEGKRFDTPAPFLSDVTDGIPTFFAFPPRLEVLPGGAAAERGGESRQRDLVKEGIVQTFDVVASQLSLQTTTPRPLRLRGLS